MPTGSIIDFYDDPNGFILKQKVSHVDLPAFVKTAQYIKDENRAALPDDVFALVMVDQGECTRKYACVDPGNTALSVIYFLENCHKLPEEAQKTAALNLVKACGWYDLEVPDQLQKLAGVGTLLNAGMGGMQLKGKIQQGVAKHQAAMMPKFSELSGTRAMPNQSDRPEDEEKTAGKITDAFRFGRAGGSANLARRLGGKVGKLEAAATHVGRHAKKYLAGAGAAAAGVGAEEAVRRSHKGVKERTNQLFEEGHKEAEALQPYVDVTGKQAPVRMEKVASQHTLLRGQFPVDTYGEVEEAQRWFEDYGSTLHPTDRREYCIKLAARAEELSAPVKDHVLKYAGRGYGSDVEAAVITRMQFWSEDGPERDMLKGLLEKRAEVSPEIFCAALEQFDVTTGLNHHWDSHIPDPVYSTFGIDKTAGTGWSFDHGGDRVDEHQLKCLAKSDHKQLCKKFGKEFVEEFTKKPREIFSSLPLDTKRIIMRMANDPQP